MDSMLTHHAHLNGLSMLDEHRVSSLPESIMATLNSVAAHLSVRSSFLLDLDPQRQLVEISAAYHADAGSDLLPGTRWALSASDTSDAPLFAPLVLADSTAIANSAGAVPFLTEPPFAQIAAYVSVPITFVDGTVFGFLCGVDRAARQFTAAQMEILILLARYLATTIEREREMVARRNAETQLQRALATLRATHGEMERMQKLKSDFVTIVNHEFRTALTGIQGFSEIVRDEDCSPDEVKEFAADINADARRLNRLITDMLDLDRMEAGKLRLAAGRVTINTLITDLVTRFSLTVPRHTIAMEFDPSLASLPGDSDKLEQALSHLLKNAVKFSPVGGAISVSTRRVGDTAQVSIHDEGVGIPADELERIFERFTRVEDSTSRYIQGTGLGLSIVRDIVQLHGGKVWAESVLGQGATFHITLPLTNSR